MFEWKPPDPRLVALVRRLEAAVLRRFPARDASTSTAGEEIDGDKPSGPAEPMPSERRDDDPPTV